jgi:phospholipid/cholesterol/gamma-HCH transport system substrate-binding protein
MPEGQDSSTASPANYWKLGMFVLIGVALVAIALAIVGARSLHHDTIQFVTYFDESVQGLGLGAPTTFRGVPLGTVSGIHVAPDRRRVEVVMQLERSELLRAGYADTDTEPEQPPPPGLRAQLGSQGITGVRFILIDYFDPEHNPPPALPFAPDHHYIPAAESTLRTVEQAVVLALERLPEVGAKVGAVVGRLDRLLGDFEGQQMPLRIGASLRELDRTMRAVQGLLVHADVARVSDKAQATLDGMKKTLLDLDRVFERLAGENGLLSRAERTTQLFGDVAQGGTSLEAEMRTLIERVSQATESFRRLADALERDPDMLIKGRREGRAYK